MFSRPSYVGIVKQLVFCFFVWMLCSVLIYPFVMLEMAGAVLGLGFLALMVQGYGFVVLAYGVIRLLLEAAKDADSWQAKRSKQKLDIQE